MRRLFLSALTICILLPGVSQTHDYRAKRLFLRGTEFIYLENYKAAIKDFSEAIRLDSGFVEAYENRGVSKYYLNDYKGAIDDYNKALELKPFDYETIGRRGWAWFGLRRYEEALFDFTKALNGVADESKYYLIRGQTKYHLKDFRGALTDFDQVLKSIYSTKLQKSKAYYWMGMTKIDTGEKEAGCRDLKEARKLGLEEADLIIKVSCNDINMDEKNK